VDPETGKQYARDFIRKLEEEEASLKAQLAITPVTPAPLSRDISQSQPGPSRGTKPYNYFVGDSSGLGFLHSILSDERWQHHHAHIMNQLSARPRMKARQLTSNPLPSLEEAEMLLHNYFTRFHIHHTFLLRHEVVGIFNRLYLPSSMQEVSVQDRFRLFMVFAISSTTRHRAGLISEDPYGYFRAAEAYLGSIPLIKDLDAIQNLLLIARFGMYHHIEISLWEISQLCMRQCIEWRLHMHRSEAVDPLSEQHRRRIFWECYVLDRYSAGILGRPFAILEKDINVRLPIDVDDETLTSSLAVSLDCIPPNTNSRPTELSVFIHCIKLRQISSRIHTDFYIGQHGKSNGQPSRFMSIGHIYEMFFKFQTELKAWRSSAPMFPNPRSLYEKPEWHDFLYEKDLMLLARGALHNIPSCSYIATGVMKEVFACCYGSARRVIELYSDLMDKRVITWTRSYFQVIFTAGLTIIFCVSFDAIRNILSNEEPIQTLDLCHRILSFFKEKMPDAGSFALVFELLKDECINSRSSIDEDSQRQQHQDPSRPFITTRQNSPGRVINPNDTDLSQQTDNVNAGDMRFDPYTNSQAYNFTVNDPNLGPTDNLDFMTQLEAGLGEYAWGWIPMDNELLDHFSFH